MAAALMPAWAEDGPQNLDAGKSPAQLFASDCSACHKSPQGLAKSAGFGLTSFLREHYTASRESAAALAAYLAAVGDGPAAAAKPRQVKRSPKADDKKTGDKKVEEKKPTGAKAGDGKPADAKPVDAKPAQQKPEPAKAPAEKPVEAKPADAKPAAAKPAAAKTDDSKPAKTD